MGSFDQAFQDELKIQSWSLYSVAIFIILLRLISRARRLGSVANYQVDDYLMVFVGCLFTMLIVCLNVIAQGGGSNLYPPELQDTFTEKEIQERIKGSKIVILSEQAMLNVIYAIKACMLIMYTRLTLGLNEMKMVYWLAVYVAAGWTATEITFFTACRPFKGYWGMPPPDPQCTTLYNYAIVQGVFNISSDFLMLFIPIPLVIKLKVAMRQKIILVFIFGMGLFVIVAALMTKIFNLSDEYSPSYMLWYVREASVAVYVSNLPLIWPLLAELFPFLCSMVSSGYREAQNSGQDANREGTRFGRKRRNTTSNPRQHHLERGGPESLSVGGIFSFHRSRPGGSRTRSSLDTIELAITSNELHSKQSQDSGHASQEHIVSLMGGIQVMHTIVVQEEQRRNSEHARNTLSVYDWEHQGGARNQIDIVHMDKTR